MLSPSRLFQLVVGSPLWHSEPHTRMTKHDYEQWLLLMLKSAPDFMFAASLDMNGVREEDGSLLCFLKPTGHHTGSPFPCCAPGHPEGPQQVPASNRREFSGADVMVVRHCLKVLDPVCAGPTCPAPDEQALCVPDHGGQGVGGRPEGSHHPSGGPGPALSLCLLRSGPPGDAQGRRQQGPPLTSDPGFYSCNELHDALLAAVYQH